jgi:hypothetical protein
VPLIPITLNSHDVVDVAVTEVIVVSGIISPVAYIALSIPVVGATDPPNAETVIDEVPVLVTYTTFPVPSVADLSTTEITDLEGNSRLDDIPVIVNVQGPTNGVLNVGNDVPADAENVNVTPVAVKVCIV